MLIVDDEKLSVKYLKRVLQEGPEHFVVHTAYSASEALARLEELHGDVDAILTDQRMGGETGVELLEAVRVKFPKPARLLMSAYVDPKLVQNALQAGVAVHFIPKPLDIAVVAPAVNRAIDANTDRELLDAPVAADDVEAAAELARFVSEGLCPVGAALDMLLDSEHEISEDFVRELRDHVQELMVTMREIGGAAMPAPELDSKVPVDFVAALEAARAKAALFAQQTRIRFEVETAPGLVLVPADPARVDAFFRLLLAAGTLFTPPGTTLHIRIAPEVGDGEVVGINVEIDHELALLTVKNSVFFDSEDVPLPRIGLFLRACMRIVKEHSGTVCTRMEGKPEGWLRFTFPVA